MNEGNEKWVQMTYYFGGVSESSTEALLTDFVVADEGGVRLSSAEAELLAEDPAGAVSESSTLCDDCCVVTVRDENGNHAYRQLNQTHTIPNSTTSITTNLPAPCQEGFVSPVISCGGMMVGITI